jgi:hypothetical protein
VPVKAGAYTVHYAVAAGLAGKAKASGPLRGQFAVYIKPAPAPTHVNPKTGRVEVGQYPATPTTP